MVKRDLSHKSLTVRRAVLALPLLAFMVVPMIFEGSPANATVGSQSGPRQVDLAQSASFALPVPLQTEAVAGPWRMTVAQVVTGDDATALVIDASPFNDGPADGFTYVAVRLQVTNAGNIAYDIDSNDFGVVGDSGIVRRFVGAVAPSPALDAVLAPGEQTEGWIVAGAASEDANLTLLYDSLTISGDWPDRVFALTDGATIAVVDKRPVALNKVGRSLSNPVGFNTAIVTRDWSIELLEVVQGAAVADLFLASDYRTTALLGSDPANSPVSQTWIAFRILVTNNRTGNAASYFPLSAFNLANGDGSAVTDLQTLSAPNPEAAGWYLPGAFREGWVVLDLLTGTGEIYDGALLRFVPYRTDDDVRYIAWDGSGVTVDDEPSFTGTLAEGTMVRVIEDQVRLRSEPSTTAEIVEELTKGTELTVTGTPEEADGFTWYPVSDSKTGTNGFIAQQLIEPVG